MQNAESRIQKVCGVIPCALPMAARLAKAIRDYHPAIDLIVPSQSSIEILRNLEELSIDIVASVWRTSIAIPCRRSCRRRSNARGSSDGPRCARGIDSALAPTTQNFRPSGYC